MLAIKRRLLSIPLLALTAAVLAPTAAHALTAGDSSALLVLNTSSLWADTQSYHACNVTNISTSNINLSVQMIDQTGAVLATSGAAAITVAAGTNYELINATANTYTGFARCRVSLYTGSENIRANMTVFHSLGGAVYQTYATSEAR
jgi:hypothetical protein